MKVFWYDCGDQVDPGMAMEMTLDQADLRWSDGSGAQGNFFGLIDDQDRTIQFYFDESVPDDVEDASHLRIVLMDFPDEARGGSLGRHVSIGEVRGLIETAFKMGADPAHFGELTFTQW